MALRHPDPFEDLNFDERFVREARFLEPSAAERAGGVPRGGGARCQVVPAPRGLQGFVHRFFVAPPGPKPPSRRLARVLAALTLTVGVISVTFVALRHTAGRGMPVATRPVPGSAVHTPVGGPAAGSGAGPLPTGGPVGTGPVAEPTGLTTASAADPAAGVPEGFALTLGLLTALRPGDCLAWSPGRGDPVAPVRVDCAAPHVDEVTRIVDLADRFERWPGAEALRATAKDACAGSLREYVGAVDVAPNRVIGSVRPDQASWEEGARKLVCTIRSDDLVARGGPFLAVGTVFD